MDNWKNTLKNTLKDLAPIIVIGVLLVGGFVYNTIQINKLEQALNNQGNFIVGLDRGFGIIINNLPEETKTKIINAINLVVNQ